MRNSRSRRKGLDATNPSTLCITDQWVGDWDHLLWPAGGSLIKSVPFQLPGVIRGGGLAKEHGLVIWVGAYCPDRGSAGSPVVSPPPAAGQRPVLKKIARLSKTIVALGLHVLHKYLLQDI